MKELVVSIHDEAQSGSRYGLEDVSCLPSAHPVEFVFCVSLTELSSARLSFNLAPIVSSAFHAWPSQHACIKQKRTKLAVGEKKERIFGPSSGEPPKNVEHTQKCRTPTQEEHAHKSCTHQPQNQGTHPTSAQTFLAKFGQNTKSRILPNGRAKCGQNFKTPTRSRNTTGQIRFWQNAVCPNSVMTCRDGSLRMSTDQRHRVCAPRAPTRWRRCSEPLYRLSKDSP